jgi:hypothetical protein
MKDYERKKRKRIKNLLMMDAEDLMPPGEGTFNPANRWTFRTGVTNTTPTATFDGTNDATLSYNFVSPGLSIRKYQVCLDVNGTGGNLELTLGPVPIAGGTVITPTNGMVCKTITVTAATHLMHIVSKGFTGTITNISIR